METSVLNAAHERQRRAEALLREGRFEEAAKCHETVASLLAEAQSQIENNFVHLRTSVSNQDSPSLVTSIHSLITLESLALQRDYHKRQAAVVRMKQARYEEYKATLESQQREILNKQAPKQLERDSNTELQSDKLDGSLRQAIYRTIEEQDSLLSLISLPNNDEKAFKHPKDNCTIIEELKTVNCQLRCLVGNLLSQLEAKEEEVRKLSERLNAVSGNPNDSEIRSDDPHSLRLAPLPPLTPLEMPLFDFTST